ncbi:hypothetical protein [Martelella sp. AMO21009]
MLIEAGDLVSQPSNVARPLPPKIEFDHAAGRFSGTAQPGMSIRLTSNLDAKMHSVVTNADGSWAIDLGASPRWFAIFKLWACDAAEGVSSDKIQITLGGNTPKMKDVYASRTGVFGISSQNADITVYGPNGNIVGKSFAISKYGDWSADFMEPLKAGDEVCIVATAFNGNASKPYFAKLQSFSVEKRRTDYIAGSGAKPGEKIQIFDLKSSVLVGSTTASAKGIWSVSFCKALENGNRLRIRRILPDGTTVAGPTILASSSYCLVPEVDAVNRTYGSTQLMVRGTGVPNYEVIVKHSSSSSTVIRSWSTTVKGNGSWSTPFTGTLNYGDVVSAETTYGGADSYIYSALSPNSNAARPAPPQMQPATGTQIVGKCDANSWVAISTQASGVIKKIQANPDGTFTTNLSQVPNFNNTYFYYEASPNANPDIYQPTSILAVQQGNNQIKPNRPELTTWDGYTFAGNVPASQYDSQYNGTKVKVFDLDIGRQATITDDDLPVLADRTFTTDGMTIDDVNPSSDPTAPPIPYGARVQAQAHFMMKPDPSNPNAGPGPTSDLSQVRYVAPNGGITATRPWPPEIDAIRVSGSSIKLTGTAVYNATVNIFTTGDVTAQTQANGDGDWNVTIPNLYISSTPQLFSATSTLPGGNSSSASDAFVSAYGSYSQPEPDIQLITTDAVWVSVPDNPVTRFVGWSTNTGVMMVNITPTASNIDPTIKGDAGQQLYKLPFEDGQGNPLQLSTNDNLNLSACTDYPNSIMSAFNTKVEGYDTTTSP